MEGEGRAFERRQLEIIETSNDHSIFCIGRMRAASRSPCALSGRICSLSGTCPNFDCVDNRAQEPNSMTNFDLFIKLPVSDFNRSAKLHMAGLNCRYGWNLTSCGKRNFKRVFCNRFYLSSSHHTNGRIYVEQISIKRTSSITPGFADPQSDTGVGTVIQQFRKRQVVFAPRSDKTTIESLVSASFSATVWVPRQALWLCSGDGCATCRPEDRCLRFIDVEDFSYINLCIIRLVIMSILHLFRFELPYVLLGS